MRGTRQLRIDGAFEAATFSVCRSLPRMPALGDEYKGQRLQEHRGRIECDGDGSGMDPRDEAQRKREAERHEQEEVE